MRATRWCFVLGLCALAAVGCQGDPDVRETITALRVMGIQATPPEARPGDKIQLAALVARVPAATISYSWYLCKDPDTSRDGCHTDGSLAVSEVPTPEFSVPADYLDGVDDPAVALRGRYLFVTLVAQAGAQEVVATKRIVVSSAPTNQNPTLEALKVYATDGETLQTAPYIAPLKQKIRLVPTPGDGASQPYEVIAPNGDKSTATERLYFSWYTTRGTYTQGYLTQAPAPENTFVAPEEPPDDPKTTLFVVLRDGRGGITWQTVEIEIK